MQTTDVIAITGAAGFIGSYFTGLLNKAGYKQLILVDDFTDERKKNNLKDKSYTKLIPRDEFIQWADDNAGIIRHIFHLGARTDTTEMDYSIHKKLNLDYSKEIWRICAGQQIPLVYASSAATYGSGEHGYKDTHNIVDQLQPLNPYGISKNEFDKWALSQEVVPPFWAGVKFFNVYGPNEYHKGRMASVIFHAYRQVKEKGAVKLFRSHREDYKDGEQIRDFIYVKDVADICRWLMQTQPASGLYNIGTGNARTFNDLATAIFNTLNIPVYIEYIDTPEDIRDKYQYYTEADMDKLHDAGYTGRPTTLEEGVNDYVNNYLETNTYY